MVKRQLSQSGCFGGALHRPKIHDRLIKGCSFDPGQQLLSEILIDLSHHYVIKSPPRGKLIWINPVNIAIHDGFRASQMQRKEMAAAVYGPILSGITMPHRFETPLSKSSTMVRAIRCRLRALE